MSLPLRTARQKRKKIAAYAALQIGIGEVRVKMVTSTGTSPTAFAPDTPMAWSVNTGILSGTSRTNLSAQATTDELAQRKPDNGIEGIPKNHYNGIEQSAPPCSREAFPGTPKRQAAERGAYTIDQSRWRKR